MITIDQCRGARGLLDWTQQDLADASGLSKTAINNFEKSHSDIKAESLRAIRFAFESADIEFIDNVGVTRKTENCKNLSGPNALNELIDDIHLTLSQRTEDEILISFVEQSLAGRITTSKLFKHIEFIKDNKIKQRVLCYDGSKQVLSPTDECRWLPEETKNIGTTTFIYSDKVAIETWDKSMIIIGRYKNLYTSERDRFEQLWQSAVIPATLKKEDDQEKTAVQK